MTRFKLMTAAASAVMLGLAPAALAGEMDQDKTDAKTEATMTKTVATPQARMTTTAANVQAEVRGAVERGEMIAVEGPDGNVYYNRFIPITDLPDPELELRVVDTETVEYKGMTFTNQTVVETD